MVHLDYLPGTFFGPSTLVEMVRHRARTQPRDIAFSYLVDGELEQVDLTYEELDRQARAIGAWLMSRGLAGERALLLYPAGLDFIAGFFGCLYAGVVAVPVYPPRRNRSMTRIQAIADDAEAKVALTTDIVLSRVQDLIDETPHIKQLAWLDTCHVPAGMDQQWELPDIHGETLAFLQYTSGSTGTPKGVILNHANLVHNSALIAHAFEHTRTSLGVFWLPSYHDMGLIGGILQPIYVGPAQRADVADDVPAEAVPLAVGHLALPRHQRRRSELRLRALHREGHARAAEATRSEQLEAGLQRGRAGACGNAAAVCRDVRALRFPGRGLLSVLWAGRGHAHRFRRICRQTADHPQL